MGFLGEGRRNNTVIAVKSHFHNDGTPYFRPANILSQFDRMIQLVRSPFAAFPAERKRIVATKNAHVAEVNWTDFVLGRHSKGDVWRRTTKVHWSNWTALASEKYMKTAHYLVELEALGMPVHTIRFEDLQRDTQGVMAGVLRFIGKHWR